MHNLAGKVAVITGGSKGIGEATARLMAERGAEVVVNYRSDPDAARKVVDGIAAAGGRASSAQADVSTRQGINRLFAQVEADQGRIDILVNNAGPLLPAGVVDVTEAVIDASVASNFKSVALCSSAALPLFPETGGVIINLSSETVRNTLPGSAVFASTKAAGETLTRYFAQELGPRAIRVVGVSPGYTVTPATSALPAEGIETLASRTALRRPGQPSDIASVIAFLASNEAGWITGTTLVVSG